MTTQQAIKVITDDWEALKKSQDVGGPPKSIAVWVAKSDTAGAYEVNEEWIGVTPQGNIAWAYASGCSCWDGDYIEDTKPTLKEFTLVHSHLPEEWEKMIIKFAETKHIQNL